MLPRGVAAAQEAAPPARVFHVSPQRLTSVEPRWQFTTIAAAAKAVAPGDRVIIHEGTYRESVVIAPSGTSEQPIRFEVEPAASVIVTGADVLTHWRKEPDTGTDNVFSTEWSHIFISNPTQTYPNNDNHLLVGRAEQVFVQDYPLHQVLLRAQLARGSFWVDTEHQRLYAWGSANESLPSFRVEASARPTIWQCQGSYVQVRGLTFRYAANAAQQGAAQFAGRGDVIEDCVFEETNAEGAGFYAAGQTVRRCTFQDNGQIGFVAVKAHGLLMSDCLTRNNNTKNFARGWEAGGDKVVLSRNVVIENSRFIDNKGSGIWFDIGNEACTVRNCLIADNQNAGLFYEISAGLHAHDNVVIGNGFEGTPGAWGCSAGIVLSSSAGCVVERNLLIGNDEGFGFREQARTTPRVDSAPGAAEEPAWNHDDVIRNNTFAYNRAAQVWGWFDVADDRHWPRAMQTVHGQEAPPAKEGAGDPVPKPGTDLPAYPSLENLHLTFVDNVYAVREEEGLFHWGTEWRRRRYYPNLEEVRAELGLEQGSVAAPLVFADFLTHDLRVPADSAAHKLDAYPRGNVPDVRLGVAPAVSGTAEAEHREGNRD